jgi:hypothetical protein
VSLDLEVRSDDEYSKTAQRELVVAYLRDEVRARATARDSLVYDHDGCWVEITIGHEYSTTTAADVVSWVGLRVPAGAAFKSGAAAYRISMAVAHRLRWRVYDPQRDDYVPATELEPGPSFREAIATLASEARQEGVRRLLVRTAHRLRRQSVASVGYMAASGFITAAVAARLLGYRFELYPRTIALAASALAAVLLLGDVVLDVLGAVHQDALRRKGRAAEQADAADGAQGGTRTAS